MIRNAIKSSIEIWLARYDTGMHLQLKISWNSAMTHIQSNFMISAIDVNQQSYI